jgi:hypothetical protein
MNGGAVVDTGGGVVETMFEHLNAHDWDSFSALLSPDVERIGPFGERVVGRDAYVTLMASAEPSPDDDGERTRWDVHCVAYTSDGHRGFARVTARVPQDGGELRIEEALVYGVGNDGLISGIEVFWRDPRS